MFFHIGMVHAIMFVLSAALLFGRGRSEQAPESEQGPEPEPEQQPEAEAEPQQEQEPEPALEPEPQPEPEQEQTCWVTKSGRSYHLQRSCSTLSRSKNLNEMTVDEAKSQGYEPCDVCC